MIVSKINLTNFRGYKKLELSFTPGINLLVGDNAVGKTSIIEAIYFLSLARSFRTPDDSELIKEKENFARVRAQVIEGVRKKDIDITISESGKRIVSNNNVVSRLSELSEAINVISFQPKDVLMFDDSPKVRRTFLDVSIAKQDSMYLGLMSKYEKILKERNELLKSDKVDEIALEVITDELILVSKEIVVKRDKFIKTVNNYLSTIVKHIKGDKEEIELVYKPFVELDDKFIESAQKAFLSTKENDLKRKTTNIGVHREDYYALLNGNNLAEFGSQGEKRMVVLGLKLCPYFIIEERDKKPIVVLDDVMSELDTNHKKLLVKFLSKFEQVFITANKLTIKGASLYEVSNHKIVRRIN